MKILVPVKRVVDPIIAVRIDADGLNIVRDNVPHAMNPFDEVALAQAASLRKAGIADELVAVSIGPDKAEETLRTALAMGADRALHIVSSDTDQLQPFDIARILQTVCEEEQPDLVLMGKQAIDSDAGQTPALLAGFLNLPFLPDTTMLSIEGGDVITTFDLEGLTTRAKAALPAILGCELHLFDSLPVSLPQIMKARQKPLARKNLDELDLDLTKTTTSHALKEPATRPPCRLFDHVSELADQLKSDGLLS